MRQLPENPFFDELAKLAGVVKEAADDVETNETSEPMNPDRSPKKTQDDADAERAKEGDEKEEELQEKKDEIQNDADDSRKDKEASAADELMEQIASALPEFGALAKLYELAQGRDEVSDELFKAASTRLDSALTDEESYTEVITKTAEELFGAEENLAQLYSEEGLAFVVEKLAEFLENEELQKIAGDGDNFLKRVQEGAGRFVNSVRNLGKINEELQAAQAVMHATNQEALQEFHQNNITPRYMQLTDQYNEQAGNVADLMGQKRMGQIGKGLAFGGAAAGALYGGKKLYDALHDDQGEEQVAAAADKVLLTKVAGGKLREEYPYDFDRMGGRNSMKNQLVRDFLKIAGAAGLIDIASNESLDVNLRKEASAQFNEIASMGRTAMDEALVKVAMDIYPENTLHEVVAGQHTEQLFSKIAYVLEWNDLSADELQKVAGADGVAAKGVAGALTDAKANIQEAIEQGKKDAEGDNREYVGVVQGSSGANKDGKETGVAGGGIIAKAMAGYNVTNSPESYKVDKTAAAIEEAVLAKQAALEVIERANAYLAQFGK